MDLGRPKQTHSIEMPNPSAPALEDVVRSHSAQLTEIHSELSSAVFQVTGEMGEIQASAASNSSTLSALSNQVAALVAMMERLHHPPARPAAPVPSIPQGEPFVSRAKPNPPFPERYSGDPDKCLGFLKECRDYTRSDPSAKLADGTEVGMIYAALTGQAREFVQDLFGRHPWLRFDLATFSAVFRRRFERPSNGAGATVLQDDSPQGPPLSAPWSSAPRSWLGRRDSESGAQGGPSVRGTPPGPP